MLGHRFFHSPLWKLIFDTSGWNLYKINYDIFLLLSNFAWFSYFSPIFLSRIVVLWCVSLSLCLYRQKICISLHNSVMSLTPLFSEIWSSSSEGTSKIWRGCGEAENWNKFKCKGIPKFLKRDFQEIFRVGT